MNLLTENVIVYHKGDKYKISKEPLQVGDHVLDKEDMLHAVVVSIDDNLQRCKISDGAYTETGVPIEKLWKLVLFEKILQPFKL